MNECLLQVLIPENYGYLWPNLCTIILTSAGIFAGNCGTLQRGLRTFSRLWIFELQVICFQNIWASGNHVLENGQYLQTSISTRYVGLGHVHIIRTERYNHWAFWGYFSFLTYHKYSPRIENQESWLKLYHSAYFILTFYSPQATRSLFTLFSTFPIMAGGLRPKTPTGCFAVKKKVWEDITCWITSHWLSIRNTTRESESGSHDYRDTQTQRGENY